MIFYATLPFFAIALIVFQSTLADVLFSSWLALEASLVVVIYAGFRFSAIRGLTVAFIMGFVLDSLSGSVLGLMTLIYMAISTLSYFVSRHVAAEKLFLIGTFGFVCALLEGFTLWVIYRLVYDFDRIGAVTVFVPQALIVGALSVGFFHTMRGLEKFFNGSIRQSAQRAGTI